MSPENLQRIIETGQDSNGSPSQRIKIIEEHCKLRKNEPTVLLSPSLHTGLDLNEDLSRFQIQTKVPWPDSSDKWIVANKERNPEWYKWQTALRLIQTYGRSIRSKEDYAITYVLDALYKKFVQENEKLLPKWYRDAIIWKY